MTEALDLPGPDVAVLERVWTGHGEDRAGWYRLDFAGRISVDVRAVAADDTVAVTLGDAAEAPEGDDVSASRPWADVLGCAIRWSWHLTNNRGYPDGLQFEFVRDGTTASVIQLMVVASRLKIGVVDFE